MTAIAFTTNFEQTDARAATKGAVRLVLRAEGLAVLALSVAGYRALGGAWWQFAVLFLAPDLSMLGYLLGRRIGAVCYNLAHSYLAPVALAALAWSAGRADLVALCLIWTAHIGFDRLMGYGLKYSSGFGHTHLGWVGKARRDA